MENTDKDDETINMNCCNVVVIAQVMLWEVDFGPITVCALALGIAAGWSGVHALPLGVVGRLKWPLLTDLFFIATVRRTDCCHNIDLVSLPLSLVTFPTL